MNIEAVEEPKKYENYHTKPVSDPFKTIADHRKVRELPRKMNIEEVEEPETMKIHRQNPRPTTAATPKLRKFTYKTNMQARKHENSDEFCPPPRSSHPAFSPTVRTPSVNHTVWGNMQKIGKIQLQNICKKYAKNTQKYAKHMQKYAKNAKKYAKR